MTFTPIAQLVNVSCIGTPSPQASPPPPHPALTETDLNCILTVISASWCDSTKTTYGAGLLVFHVFCDVRSIPEIDCCPIAQPLLLTFLSSCAGSCAGSTLANYSAGLHAWHLLHGRPWLIDQKTLKAMLEGAARLAPPSSKQPLRPLSS